MRFYHTDMGLWTVTVFSSACTVAALLGAIHLMRSYRGFGVSLLAVGAVVASLGSSAYHIVYAIISKGSWMVSYEGPRGDTREAAMTIAEIGGLILQMIGLWLVVLAMFFVHRISRLRHTDHH